MPRAVFVQHPFGRLLGDVGNRTGQRRICDAMREVLASATGPNHYRHLPDEWPEPPDAVRWRPAVEPPLARYAEERGLDVRRTLATAMNAEPP